MIQEWFHHALRDSGHRPLCDFYKVRPRTGVNDVKEGLKKLWEVVYFVDVGYPEARKMSVGFIERGAAEFSTWTSFESTPSVTFAFRDLTDAVAFRLMID